MADDILINMRIGGEEALERSVKSVVQTTVQAANKASREQIRASKEASDAAKRAAKEEADAKKRALKEAADFEKELDRASRRRFQERVREQDRARRQQEQQARAHAKALDSFHSGYRGAATRGLSNAASGVANVASMALGGFGAATAFDAVKKQLDIQKRVALLQNQVGSKGLGKTGDFGTDAAAFSNKMKGVISSSDALGLYENIAQKAGGEGLAEAAPQLENLTKIAIGAGVSMDDLGAAIGGMLTKGVKGDEMVKVVEGLVQQGKDGSVEFKQLASLLDSSTGALLKFKTAAGDRVLQAGGLSQIAKTFGKKSAEESTNSVVDLARDMAGKADLIQTLTGGKKAGTRLVGGKKQAIIKGGVDVGVEGTNRAQLKDIIQTLPDIIEGLAKNKNLGKLEGQGGIFTGNASAITTPLAQAFTLGITKNKSGRYEITQDGQTSDLKGKEAVKELLKQFTEAAPKAGESLKAFENVTQTSSVQFSAAMNLLTQKMGQDLAPRIVELTPHLLKLGEALGTAISFIAESPKKALALYAGANVGKELIGQFLKTAFSSVSTMTVTAANVSVGGGGPTPPGGAGAGAGVGGAMKPGANLATAGAVLAGAGIGAALGGAMVSDMSGKHKSTEDLRRSYINESNDLYLRLGTDKERRGDRERAQQIMNAMDQGTSQEGGFGSRFAKSFANPYKELASGNVTLGNVAKALPFFNVAASLTDAASGGKNQDEAGKASAALKEALKQPMKIQDGTKFELAQMDQLLAAVRGGGGRDPNTDPIVKN